MHHPMCDTVVHSHHLVSHKLQCPKNDDYNSHYTTLFLIYSSGQKFKTTLLSTTFLGAKKWDPSALSDLLA